MPAFAYVGTVEEAAGFRLAGVHCWTPQGDEAAALRAALASAAEAVFVTAAVAACVPRPELNAALAAGRPLLVLVPDNGSEFARLDPAQRVRGQLGLER